MVVTGPNGYEISMRLDIRDFEGRERFYDSSRFDWTERAQVDALVVEWVDTMFQVLQEAEG